MEAVNLSAVRYKCPHPGTEYSAGRGIHRGLQWLYHPSRGLSVHAGCDTNAGGDDCSCRRSFINLLATIKVQGQRREAGVICGDNLG